MITYIMGIVLLASAIVMLRVLLGPTFADRVIAAEALMNIIILFIAGWAVYAGHALYLDVALALALLSFIGAVAIARYVVKK
jgi:multicomponent Na+:H+ antiporter subunit F